LDFFQTVGDPLDHSVKQALKRNRLEGQ